MDNNRVIGNENDLPWKGKLPADMRHFRKLTIHKMVVTGRETFESIFKAIGKPLPERTNIILTENPEYKVPGCTVLHSVSEVLKIAQESSEEVMIIGGALVYKQFLQYSDRMYLTLIDHDFEGDTYFPEFDETEWEVKEKTEHEPDQENHYPYTFLTLERKISKE